jgi:hypothetical protein
MIFKYQQRNIINLIVDKLDFRNKTTFASLILQALKCRGLSENSISRIHRQSIIGVYDRHLIQEIHSHIRRNNITSIGPSISDLLNRAFFANNLFIFTQLLRLPGIPNEYIAHLWKQAVEYPGMHELELFKYLTKTLVLRNINFIPQSTLALGLARIIAHTDYDSFCYILQIPGVTVDMIYIWLAVQEERGLITENITRRFVLVLVATVGTNGTEKEHINVIHTEKNKLYQRWRRLLVPFRIQG